MSKRWSNERVVLHLNKKSAFFKGTVSHDILPPFFTLKTLYGPHTNWIKQFREFLKKFIISNINHNHMRKENYEKLSCLFMLSPPQFLISYCTYVHCTVLYIYNVIVVCCRNSVDYPFMCSVLNFHLLSVTICIWCVLFN